MKTNLKNLNYKKKILIITLRQSRKKIFYYSGTKKRFLLNILEKENVQVDYQCRKGYCGFCRIVLYKGIVFYNKINKPIAVLQKKEILPCCCIIKDNIILDI